MTTTLTDEMRQALALSGKAPVYVEDPQTKVRYVLVSKADYDRIGSLLDIDEANIAETYAFQESVAHAQGWDDPQMDEYNDYDQRKKTA